jgi:hypothetical protein
MTTWMLVHSPLVGPMTWEPVADELRRGGVPALVPDIGADEEPGMPFWRYHARTLAGALASLPRDDRIVFAAHSGAGPLLPAIAEELGRPVDGYLFVDAGLPADGALPAGDGGFAEHLRNLYAAGGCFPSWTDEELREIVPDAAIRRHLVASQRPRPWPYWEQPVPVPPAWPDAPCAYLRFEPNPAYDEAAAEASRRGWPSLEMAGGHFHMLVDPAAVVGAMCELVTALGSTRRPCLRLGDRSAGSPGAGVCGGGRSEV